MVSFSIQFSRCFVPRFLRHRGDGEIRTLDPLLARQVLSQLSYTPASPATPLILSIIAVNKSPTDCSASLPQSYNHSQSALSRYLLMFVSVSHADTSDHASVLTCVIMETGLLPYMLRRPPALPCRLQHSTIGRMGLNRRVRYGYGCFPHAYWHRSFSGPLDP